MYISKTTKGETVKTNNTTDNSMQKNNGTLFFNLAIMLTSFTVALVALPQEMFFVVAVIVLIALRMIEKDIAKSETRRASMLTKM